MERRHFLDNIRWMTVLLLFPFHSLIIYNNFGEGNYIKGSENTILTNILSSYWPWFMPLLFVLAGISSVYALQKRKTKDFIIERVRKLFIPLFFGILIICPFLTFYAECYHNEYSGTYIYQYILFFTKETNLTGYNGGFTPGHLWFILYLFIVSLISIPIIYFFPKRINTYIEKMNIFMILLLFLLPFFGQYILNIGGKSIGEYFCYYIIGCFVLSNNRVIEKCVKHWQLLGILSFVGASLYLIFFNYYYNGFLIFLGKFYGFCSILFIIGIGKLKLDFSNKITSYFSKISFGIYLFHLPWITVIAYYTIKYIQNIYIQAITITLLSFPFTILTIEILRKILITRFMFCLKK
jgi:peptidoglycan/LPS O-acetylase OafA/YrhL